MVTPSNFLQTGVTSQSGQNFESPAITGLGIGQIADTLINIGSEQMEKRKIRRINTEFSEGLTLFDEARYSIEDELKEQGLIGDQYFTEYANRLEQAGNEIINKIPSQEARDFTTQQINQDSRRLLANARAFGNKLETEDNLAQEGNQLQRDFDLLLRSDNPDDIAKTIDRTRNMVTRYGQSFGLSKEQVEARTNDKLKPLLFAKFQADLQKDVEFAKTGMEAGLYQLDEAQKVDASALIEKAEIEEERKQQILLNREFEENILENLRGANDIESIDTLITEIENPFYADISAEAKNSVYNQLASKRRQLLDVDTTYQDMVGKLSQGMKLTEKEAQMNAEISLFNNQGLGDKSKPESVVLAETDMKSKQMSTTAKNVLESAARAINYDESMVTTATGYLQTIQRENPEILQDLNNNDRAILNLIQAKTKLYGDSKRGFDEAKAQIVLENTPEYQRRMEIASDRTTGVGSVIAENISKKFDKAFFDIPFDFDVIDWGIKKAVQVGASVFNNYTGESGKPNFTLPNPDPIMRQEMEAAAQQNYALTGDMNTAIESAIQVSSNNWAINSNGKWERNPVELQVTKAFSDQGATINSRSALKKFKELARDLVTSSDQWKTQNGKRMVIDEVSEMGVPLLNAARFDNDVKFIKNPLTENQPYPDYYIYFRDKNGNMNPLLDNKNQKVTLRFQDYIEGDEQQMGTLNMINTSIVKDISGDSVGQKQVNMFDSQMQLNISKLQAPTQTPSATATPTTAPSKEEPFTFGGGKPSRGVSGSFDEPTATPTQTPSATAIPTTAPSKEDVVKNAFKLIKKHEDFSEKSYLDKGYLSIGYGTRANGRVKISKEQAEKEGLKFVENAYKIMATTFQNFEQIPEEKQSAILNLSYNMGVNWANIHPTAASFIKQKQWDKAANELLRNSEGGKSLYYRELPKRSIEVVKMIADNPDNVNPPK